MMIAVVASMNKIINNLTKSGGSGNEKNQYNVEFVLCDLQRDET